MMCTTLCVRWAVEAALQDGSLRPFWATILGGLLGGLFATPKGARSPLPPLRVLSRTELLDMDRPKRILIVEDEPLVAIELEHLVTDFGFEVVGHADTCVEAIRLAEETRPDAVLLDYHLKGDLNGVTAAQELSKRPVRIVFITGFLDQIVKDTHDIADAYLSKPFSAEDVMRALTGERTD